MKKKKLMKKQSYFVVLLMLLLLFPSGAFAQQQMIKGQVVDDKGDTVIGATVMLKGTQEGAITDIDGNFSIKGKVGNTLTISYVGFSPLEVKVTKLEGNRFVLKEDSKVLDEVVVVGMDIQSPNQKIPDRKTKCVIKTHINIKQNVIFGAKLKPV